MEVQINSGIKNRTLVIKVSGKLNTTTAPELETRINEEFRPTLPLDTLILDLSELSYISSAGLRVLMALQKNIMKQRYGTRSLILQNPSGFCMQVFETIGVDAFFNIRRTDD